MERANSTGVLPMNRQFMNQSRYQHESQLGGITIQGTGTHSSNLSSVISGNAITTTAASNANANFFRTSTPLGVAAPSLGSYGPHPTNFGSSPTKLNPFGHTNTRTLPSNKEVHA
jgi:hypothetical protein